MITDGLFGTFAIEVRACPVIVVEGLAVLASNVFRLSNSGIAIQRQLIAAAAAVQAPPAKVSFARALLQAQRRFIQSLPADADLTPRWRPALPAANDSAPDPVSELARVVRGVIASGAELSGTELFQCASAAWGGTRAEGRYTAKDAFEAVEAAVNGHILAMGAAWAPAGDAVTAAAIAAEIESVLNRMPSQARFRDAEQLQYQQFSTPQHYAFALAWAAGLSASDVVVEPSAGNGALAVHARNAGATVHVNEIAERRRKVLALLGFSPTREDAAQIHNVWKAAAPSVVLMNPPFSRDERFRDQKARVAEQHLSAALALLADGGRLLAVMPKRIAGELAGLDRARYSLRANILVGGGLYAPFGTSVETRVVWIEKQPCSGAEPVAGKVDTVGELISRLAQVRAMRPHDAQADARFLAYTPSVRIAGARPHPSPLVESVAMAAIKSPELNYRPHFPTDVVTSGRLSIAQLEVVCAAGQEHERFMLGAGGRRVRCGYMIGDGTGVGKGREAAGIICNNWHKGLRRHVWVTADDNKLLAAAQRDIGALGLSPKVVFSLRDVRLGEPVKRTDGVLVVSHGQLRSVKGEASRLRQILHWVGGDEFDGVLILDESHRMGNALDMETDRGKQRASKTALAGIDVQRALPLARVVYMSATGADHAKNMGYCDRLGLWGPEAPFATKEDFVASIEAGGIVAQEILPRDLKAMGRLCARSLSYDGVKYERLVHPLTVEQRNAYDTMARAWRLVLRKLNTVLADCGHDGRARGVALSQFWSAHQRFFQTVLVAFQMPSVVEAIERDLAAGACAVVQLTNTLEAQQERALSRENALDDLEALDLTPRETLMQYLEAAFPIIEHEEFVNEDGNLRSRAALDAAGNPIRNKAAVLERDQLIADLGILAVPNGPLEILLDHFGVDRVAEVTGRARRVTYRPNEAGTLERQIERRNRTAVMADIRAYADAKKDILIFSAAGGTGVDFHASLDVPNQRLRRHYILQAGWNAKEATQGFGRTHRSYQKQPPEYVLVTTDLNGQKRFVTSIARRLGQLGAMTKGQRNTGDGVFSAADNLECQQAQQAVRQMVYDLWNEREVAGMSFREFEDLLALNLTHEGQLVDGRIPPVRQFLNRLLSLDVADMNIVFAEFYERLEENVQRDIANGTYNVGIEDLRADRVEVITPARVVHTEGRSGAETYYVHLRAWRHRNPRRFEIVANGDIGKGPLKTILGWVRARESGRVFAVVPARNAVDPDGTVREWRRVVGAFVSDFCPADNIGGHEKATFVPIDEKQAGTLWNREVEETGEWETQDLHMICGVLLPVWNKIGGSGLVRRVTAEDGTVYLGRLIGDGFVRPTLVALGADTDDAWTAKEAADAVLSGKKLQLSNGWRLVRSRVGEDRRIEVAYKPVDARELQRFGLHEEIIAYKTRFFVPVGDERVMSELLDAHPVVG